jgi:L,D-peptidoglycan transpeptidase YkuD (ErfK/YbiS/YcfS/YnhG family)
MKRRNAYRIGETAPGNPSARWTGLIFMLLCLQGCKGGDALVKATANSNDARGDQAGRADLNKEALKLPLINPTIIVFKSKRRLELYSNDAMVRAYRVGLGTSPVGDKVRQGDRRTPEGQFYICIKNSQSKYYLSLGLSYPNEEDAERGLREGLIDRARHKAIVDAIKGRRTPPQNTALGGEIFIHGHGSDADWTWGCVALDNRDIKELFEAIPLGTKVVINP